MNATLRSNPAPVPSSCSECCIYDVCGGWDDIRRERGCFQRCEKCFSEPCDYTCPANPALFVKSVDEVRGLGTLPDRVLSNKQDLFGLPAYIPQIEHRGKRNSPLREPLVSIPLNRLCTISRRGKVELKFSSGESLRDELKLGRSTKVLITCVTKDYWIEGLYENRRRLLPLLKALDPVGMTVPNFSFVRDSPRSNSIWNQTKGFRMIEHMADAGLETIPHLQAQTIRDWRRLESLFNKFPSLGYACMEFQTGLHDEDPDFPSRETYKQHFRNFQQSTGGRVHPVVLAGYREIGFLSEVCRSFSIIDANVFVKSANYQESYFLPDGTRRWRTISQRNEHVQSQLLTSNIVVERDYLFKRHGLDSQGKAIAPFLPRRS